MAAGAHGERGARVHGLVEVGCSLPNVSATTRHLGTTGATARAREPSIGPVTSHHVHLQVSTNTRE